MSYKESLLSQIIHLWLLLNKHWDPAPSNTSTANDTWRELQDSDRVASADSFWQDNSCGEAPGWWVGLGPVSVVCEAPGWWVGLGPVSVVCESYGRMWNEYKKEIRSRGAIYITASEWQTAKTGQKAPGTGTFYDRSISKGGTPGNSLYLVITLCNAEIPKT